MVKRRLDAELVARGLATSKNDAKTLIASRNVIVGGSVALNHESLVDSSQPIVVEMPSRFVSRGGEKLDGALDDLDLDVEGLDCLDIGAGSGGFTDCLLKRNARSVFAVDVGYGQFDWKLRNDERVTLLERANFRYLSHEVAASFDMIVADLSFISLEDVAGQIASRTRPQGKVLLLVKPQFEAARTDVPRGGIVTDPLVWRAALERVSAAFGKNGLGTIGVVASRIKGSQGNQEFFLLAIPEASSDPVLIEQAIGSAS